MCRLALNKTLGRDSHITWRSHASLFLHLHDNVSLMFCTHVCQISLIYDYSVQSYQHVSETTKFATMHAELSDFTYSLTFITLYIVMIW